MLCPNRDPTFCFKEDPKAAKLLALTYCTYFCPRHPTEQPEQFDLNLNCQIRYEVHSHNFKRSINSESKYGHSDMSIHDNTQENTSVKM